MKLSFAYMDTATQAIWTVAGVTHRSVIMKCNDAILCRYITREDFCLMTATGALAAL